MHPQRPIIEKAERNTPIKRIAITHALAVLHVEEPFPCLQEILTAFPFLFHEEMSDRCSLHIQA